MISELKSTDFEVRPCANGLWIVTCTKEEHNYPNLEGVWGVLLWLIKDGKLQIEAENLDNSIPNLYLADKEFGLKFREILQTSWDLYQDKKYK